MQLLIVWQSDLPNEARWYVLRLSGGWGLVAALIAAAHFVLPFFILLSSRAQRSRAIMIGVSVLLMAGVLLRSYWLIAPASGATSAVLAPIVVAAIAGVIAATVALALRSRLETDSKAWRHV
jgi:membrane-associated HD superfamily phosphohydrolase